MLAPSREASGKTVHRFIVSRSDSAYGRGELFWGAPLIGRRIGFLESRCVQHLLAVFGAALSGAWVRIRHRQGREGVDV